MPRAPRLDLIRKAILAGRIKWSRARYERFRDDPDFEGFTQKGINSSLQEFVKDDGEIKVKEDEDEQWRKKYPDNPCIYWVTFDLEGFRPKKVYIKMKLLWEDGDREDESVAEVVSIHRSF
jgi:hypothetical protein